MKISIILAVKIIVTLVFWCIPLILFPKSLLMSIGLPIQDDLLFVRLLGWAYLALCVGYYFAWQAAKLGVLQKGPLWVGVLSNGGAALILLYFGLSGTWVNHHLLTQILLWGSAIGAAGLSILIWHYGVKRLHT